MERTFIALVQLFINKDREGEFRTFETAAARIMAVHGGRIERVVRPGPLSSDGALPYEVHVVVFPNEACFMAFRGDAALAALAPLRQAAVARMHLIAGDEGEPYLPSESL